MTLVVENGNNALLRGLEGRLRLPVVAAPLFLISNPATVIAQCTHGVIGSFPALNARPQESLDEWLGEITQTLSAWDSANPQTPAAPYAVNLVVSRNNARLDHDLALCVKWRVPIVITSLGAREDVNRAVAAYGGTVLHDVISDRFARKAIEKGAGGLIAVAAGAGGHAGTQSPIALIQEIRRWYDGPLALSGAIATGRAILAAQVLGADLVTIGSAFIATEEAGAAAAHKHMVVAGSADDIVHTALFTGVAGNYLRPSISAADLDPDNLPPRDAGAAHTAGAVRPKAWRDIYGAGQGIGAVDAIVPTAQLIERLAEEYQSALLIRPTFGLRRAA